MLVVKFRIGGSLRFLSHAQTLRVFQRACVRAGLKIRYSRGFNPRPRLSLPLPRPVGVASDDELLCLRVHKSTSEQEQMCISEQVYKSISEQVPEGCELLSVNVAEVGASFQPCSATYVLAVRKEYLNEELKATIEHVLASESLNIQRQIGARDSRRKTQDSGIKNVDVRGFLKSIELDRNSIIVECKIGSAGSIRVDEILKLLRLDMEKLASPIRRTNVQWQKVL
ncbi:MAG TPA: TIGR03936 family radical SAM-associated protein [Sedimentisphaerales bacterium]|nr:TIGR03936 family radical SAM-associated protein [Sedimentisphaerales bacterium]